LRHSTTIGNLDNGTGQNSCPSIGNNVDIGSNVCIIGKVEIGDNVIIGAGSVVVKNIPSNCVVVGNPAKIIKYL
jgi:putative colanic acid biosynthesis acetyltransferase WcaB